MSDGKVERTAMPLLVTGGVAAAFSLASCCAIPFFLAGLGLSSAWLAGLAIYAFYHRIAFLAVALIGLAGGAILLWRRRAALKPLAVGLTAVVLSVGMALLYYGVTYV